MRTTPDRRILRREAFDWRPVNNDAFEPARPWSARDADPASKLQFLRELVSENAAVDADLLEVRQGVWVIHGTFPYDGEVPMAVFTSKDEAQRALDEVRGSGLSGNA
jgi:hypothetical protein